MNRQKTKNRLRNGVLIGFVSGLAVATGGAIKDAPYEGFDVVKFFRSPVIGGVEGALMNRFIKIEPWWMLFLAVIGTERITTEGYKVIRAKMPMKFQYGEWGVPK